MTPGKLWDLLHSASRAREKPEHPGFAGLSSEALLELLQRMSLKEALYYLRLGRRLILVFIVREPFAVPPHRITRNRGVDGGVRYHYKFQLWKVTPLHDHRSHNTSGCEEVHWGGGAKR